MHGLETDIDMLPTVDPGFDILDTILLLYLNLHETLYISV